MNYIEGHVFRKWDFGLFNRERHHGWCFYDIRWVNVFDSQESKEQHCRKLSSIILKHLSFFLTVIDNGCSRELLLSSFVVCCETKVFVIVLVCFKNPTPNREKIRNQIFVAKPKIPYETIQPKQFNNHNVFVDQTSITFPTTKPP